MGIQKSIELLRKQIEKADPLKRQEHFSPDFKKWRRDTEIIIEKIFGKENVFDFSGINSIEWDIRDIAHGLYILTVQLGDQRYQKPVVLN